MSLPDSQDEVVYGSALGDDSHVMSERVQSLAASVYQEFERMIKKYDEDVVKELMPLVVGILETLDNVFVDKQENEVELELLRDDNEQLLTQYEREKQLRKVSEQKYLETEDVVEDERREFQNKSESLESLVRLLELKARNSQDHVTRLEEKENEMKKEYSKLHERYTELFRTHMDHIERTKMFMGTEKILELGASPRTRAGFQMPNLRPVDKNALYSAVTPDKLSGSPPSFPGITSPGRGSDSNASLKHELKNLEKGEVEKLLSKELRSNKETAEKEQNTESVAFMNTSTCMKPGSGKSSTKREGQLPASAVETKDSKTTNASITNKVRPLLTVERSSSEEGDNNLSEVTLNVSQHDLDTPKEAYSIGIRVDPEDLLEDEENNVAPPGEHADSLASPETDDDKFDKTQPMGIAGQKRTNESSIFDELTMEDAHALGDVDDGCDITVSDNFFGMSKEVENLILENTELLATKNALNVVKDDLIAKVDELTRKHKDTRKDLSEDYIPIVIRSEQEILREEITSLQVIKEKLRKRVTELEDEVKRMRDDLEKERQKKGGEGEEDQEEVPMAQRKRFTRVEMARVLMERNQYKERLMELQEAVRWTEMIRASREHPDLVNRDKKKGSIWNFFSNLFSSNTSTRPGTKRPSHHPAAVKYSAPTTKVTPSGDPTKKQRDGMNMGDKGKAYDFMQDELLAEKARKERERERREQYKQVRAHVKKDDGRMQAYGWSLPAKFSAPSATAKDAAKSAVPVPVPVYCRPLLEKDDGMKLWCAAGVNLTGGRTKDGGSIVGASVFYSDPPADPDKPSAKDEIDKLDQELQEHKKNLLALENMKLSSLVWICTTLHNSSQVTVVDANKPGDILETFHVTSSHILCIASVPGATESDYPSDSDPLTMDTTAANSKPDAAPSTSDSPSQPISSEEGGEGTSVGGIRFVQCVTGAAGGSPSGETAPGTDAEGGAAAPTTEPEQSVIDPDSEVKISRATGSPASSANSTPSHGSGGPSDGGPSGAGTTELIKDGVSAGPDGGLVSTQVDKTSSVLPTMWLGCQSGSLYVHSAVSQWKRCLHSVKLKDSVLNIIHLKGRVFVALADGSLAVFHRDAEGQWDLRNYHVVDLGRPQHSIRCVCVVGHKDIWCGYRNKIHVINPKSLKLEKTFDAHPRKESQVRQLAWVGDGVWVSIRLDSTLRLYHAYTHQHLQDVDIEPYVSKMLGTGKLGFSFVRITSLLASCNRLWIGTGNGVIISVPLSENNKQAMTTTAGRPGGVIRVYSDTKTDSVTPGSFLPYCTMAQAQLSFHGHRDAVKFFVAVPGAPSKGVSGVMQTQTSPKDPKQPDADKGEKKTMLVLSGGEGYIDFRIGDTEEDGEPQEPDQKTPEGISKGDKSHLIVWNLTGKWSN